MSLCESIDTLAMAYLDDELAAEEKHELETHMTECASCRTHLDGERADQNMLRKALAAPAAPDLLRAKVVRALDTEDREQRRRWASYVLPGSAMVAAAAAIAVFVGVKPPGSQPHISSPVAKQAVLAETRQLPLEVQGASTAPWVRRNFAQLDLPAEDSLVGARLMPQGVAGHDGAMLEYQMNSEGRPFLLRVVAVRDIREEDMQDGDEVKIGGGRTLYVVEGNQGQTFVTYVDPSRHVGYMYSAPDLDTNELIGVVGGLVGPR
jgi:anti-sigma factor RsiW